MPLTISFSGESCVMAMKREYGIYPGIVVLLVSAVILSGCSSLQSTPQDKPLTGVTPEPPRFRTTITTAPPQTTAPAVTTLEPQRLETPAAGQAEITTKNLPYGITISYPRDWVLEETGVTVKRDYGREVINIANVYSPAITPNRIRAAGPNPDRSRNTILTIDVDDADVTDFERYFNRATLALQDEYESIEITKHDLQLRMSVTGTFSGYKSYQIDFDTKGLRGKYIFTNVDGTMYIFSFSNPSPYSAEVEGMYKSVIISPV